MPNPHSPWDFDGVRYFEYTKREALSPLNDVAQDALDCPPTQQPFPKHK